MLAAFYALTTDLIRISFKKRTRVKLLPAEKRTTKSKPRDFEAGCPNATRAEHSGHNYKQCNRTEYSRHKIKQYYSQAQWTNKKAECFRAEQRGQRQTEFIEPSTLDRDKQNNKEKSTMD